MTEVEMLAERAWKAMLRDIEPMPAGLALDMVQDATGDRAEAHAAIFHACARHLARQRPEQSGDDAPPSPNLNDAVAAVMHLLLGHPELALLSLKRLQERCREVYRDYHGGTAGQRHRLVYIYDRACHWLSWCAHAERCVRLCDGLGAALNPAGA